MIFWQRLKTLSETANLQSSENQVVDTSRWQQLILQRMTQEIVAVRPTLRSQSSFAALNALRGFRHFFRHVYGVPLEYEQLSANLNRVRAVLPVLEQDVERFLQQLE